MPLLGEEPLELPSAHPVPWSWLRAHACPAIQYRTARDVLPEALRTEDLLAELYAAALNYKPAAVIARKQASQGTWAGNMLGLQALKSEGVRDVGTVAQFRRLIEMGWSPAERPLKLAEKVLFRLLSRDPDPALLFEHKKASAKDPLYAEWAREQEREGSACALAEAGHVEDPRVRGAAHRIASEISHFLRSDLVDKPIVRIKGSNVLAPEARPPSIFAVAMLAHMPNVQRERAGFVQRLAAYLGHPAPRREFKVHAGRRVVKPRYTILGDPVNADATGNAKDLPLALYWAELLARLGVMGSSTTAVRVLDRQLRECDSEGVWRPKGLRSLPRAASKLTYHWFPLEASARTAEERQADVTFRLALIAKLLGWPLEIT